MSFSGSAAHAVPAAQSVFDEESGHPARRQRRDRRRRFPFEGLGHVADAVLGRQPFLRAQRVEEPRREEVHVGVAIIEGSRSRDSGRCGAPDPGEDHPAHDEAGRQANPQSEDAGIPSMKQRT